MITIKEEFDEIEAILSIMPGLSLNSRRRLMKYINGTQNECLTRLTRYVGNGSKRVREDHLLSVVTVLEFIQYHKMVYNSKNEDKFIIIKRLQPDYIELPTKFSEDVPDSVRFQKKNVEYERLMKIKELYPKVFPQTTVK